jgi:hypothetical protein
LYSPRDADHGISVEVMHRVGVLPRCVELLASAAARDAAAEGPGRTRGVERLLITLAHTLLCALASESEAHARAVIEARALDASILAGRTPDNGTLMPFATVRALAAHSPALRDAVLDAGVLAPLFDFFRFVPRG